MLVVKSCTSFAEVMRDLCGSGSLCIPVSVVPDFVAFCAIRGVYPNGGALTRDYDNTVCQWLYI